MRRILVVDEDLNTREALTFLLTGAGFEIFEAADEATAKACIERRPFDLVLIDQSAVIEGIGTLDQLSKPTRVIIITTSDGEEARRKAEALGASALVAKPLSRQRLLEFVEENLGPSASSLSIGASLAWSSKNG